MRISQNKKLNRPNVFSLLFIIFILIGSLNAYGDINSTQPQKLESPKKSSVLKSYPKEKKDNFSVEGYGEDFSKESKNRKPATENDEKKPKTKEELDKELQEQRRVDVFYEGRVRLENGASIWAVEDPGMGTPKLEIQAPNTVDVNQTSVRFRVFSNYLPFIKRWELRIFKKNNVGTDEEVITLKGDADSLFNIEYEFKKGTYKPRDVLYYKFKVFQSDNVFDVVQTKNLEFIERIENQNLDEADSLTETEMLQEIWGGNSIEKQNIPIRGSRVRIVGKNLNITSRVNHRGQMINVDQQGNFLIEEHFPIGKHQITLNVTDSETESEYLVPFEIEVTGNYFFAVGLADFRVGENKVSTKMVELASDDEYNGKAFLDGRLAMYLRGKIKGKYLITAQLDTTEGPVEDMFNGIQRKNSEALFRRLDPDRYYPVYGDNSTTTETAPTQGKLFVKIEMDQSYAMWGNDNLGTTRTLLSQYNRSLYGAHVKYKSRIQTKYGQNKTTVSAFGAAPDTLLGHNEFLGTGGRVYTLRHNDVVQGSEKVVLELRERDSGIMKKQVVLKPFEDYEFDYLAGRIVLNRDLTTFQLEDGNITTGDNVNGRDFYYLVVDYEYSPNGLSLDDTSYGASLEKWLGDYVSVGGTYVNEERANETYTLKGLDASLRLGQQSFLKVEQSETENQQSQSNFISENGGITFAEKAFVAPTNNPSASAWAVESQFFLNDFIDSKDNDGVLTTWYRDYETGFSTARRQVGTDLKEYGYNLEFNLARNNILKSKLAISEQLGGVEEQILLASYGRRFGAATTLSTEYRQEDKTLGAQVDQGKIIGVQINQRLTTGLSVYGKTQETIEEKGNYLANNRWAVGSNFRLGRKFEGSAEYSDGDRGDASVVGIGYNIDPSHRVYTNLNRSVDSSTGLDTDAITLGQRKRFKNGYTLTSENAFESTINSSGQSQLYGVDYNLTQKITTGVQYQNALLESEITGELTIKEAAGLKFAYTNGQVLRATSNASYIRDRGNVKLDQILLTNSLKFRVGPSHTFLLEGDYSKTEDPDLNSNLARFIEGNVGYAYRPVFNDRLNFFFRYTYLYDLDSQAQANARNDQKVNILSAEGSYDLTRRWEIGARIAEKVGSERIQRGSGPWLDSTLTFAQLRARYHIIKKWDGLFELRGVSLKESEDIRVGALFGIDYHLGGNLKLGTGFNFTRFNDDLVNFNFNSYGWFINIVGKM